jgi:UDP-N-acetylmuramoyl-tripeptide--D-alanyl-D-alanine ligase
MGDMGELGEAAAPLHAEVGAFAKGTGIDALIATGALSRHAAEAFGDGARHLESIEAVIDAALAETQARATVMVKGSRAMRMERVADALAPGGSAHAA